MPSVGSGMDNKDNTLHLSADRLSVLMDELDQMSQGSTARRSHARLEYRRHAVDVEVYQPSGGSVGFCVACRNISRGGMSVLHSSYMHVGTKCRVKLRHKDRGDQWLVASVVQCRHVSGRVHDVGMRFTKEIDVNDYVRLDPLSESFSLEHVEPGELSGRVLLVTGSEIEKKLIEVYLAETKLRLVHVEKYKEADSQLNEPFDVVLIDFDMDATAAQEKVQALRAAGHATSVIAISGDKSVNARDAIREARASAFVPKPIDRSALLRALAEYIILDRGAEDDSNKPQAPQETDPSLKALAELFAHDLQKFSEEIAIAVKRDDNKSLRYICARIRGTGPLLGQDAIAEAASNVLAILENSGSIEGAQEAINTLTSMCRHAKTAA